MPNTLKFRYDGERTHDPVLGVLTPGHEGEAEADVVAVKIAAGLLSAVDPAGRTAAEAILEANRREADTRARPQPDAGIDAIDDNAR